MDSNGSRCGARAGLILAAAIFLTACGGGGGGDAGSGSSSSGASSSSSGASSSSGGTVPPSAVTIGGSISGLVGTVVLQNNGSDKLSLSANGTFTFATAVASGQSYAVTVLTQPSGPDCSVTDASGSATQNITTVSVACAANPSAFYLPVSAQSSTGIANGTSGLYVLPSKSLGALPISVMRGTTSAIGYSLLFTADSSGHLSGGIPSALTFSTIGASGGDHVYALDLTANSNLTARQVSSLTFPATISAQTCGITTVYKNLADPSSAFFILALPTDANSLCSGGLASFKWLLVHLGDSATTAPIQLPALSAGLAALYQPSGDLAGFVTVDASGNLNLYPDETFANPRVLLSNVSGITRLQTPAVSALTTISADPGYSFLQVRFNNSTSSLYRIDYTGSLSLDLYDFSGTIAYGEATDTNNLYFTDAVPNTLETIAQVPLNGTSSALSLYQVDLSTGDSLGILGSTGSLLALNSFSGSTGNTALKTLPPGAPGTPHAIATVVDPTGADIQANDIFVTTTTATSGGNGYSSEALLADGTVVQPLTASSAYISAGSKTVLRVTDVTAPTGLGGGTISVIGLTQPAMPTATALKDASGQPFFVTADVASAKNFDVTTTIGYVTPQGSSNGPLAYVYDVSKDLIVNVAIPNANVSVVVAPL
jgi:hypothetical protein